MGISSLVVMVGMTAGPIICGVMYDIYGNYQLAFTAMALASRGTLRPRLRFIARVVIRTSYPPVGLPGR